MDTYTRRQNGIEEGKTGFEFTFFTGKPTSQKCSGVGGRFFLFRPRSSFSNFSTSPHLHTVNCCSNDRSTWTVFGDPNSKSTTSPMRFSFKFEKIELVRSKSSRVQIFLLSISNFSSNRSNVPSINFDQIQIRIEINRFYSKKTKKNFFNTSKMQTINMGNRTIKVRQKFTKIEQNGQLCKLKAIDHNNNNNNNECNNNLHCKIGPIEEFRSDIGKSDLKKEIGDENVTCNRVDWTPKRRRKNNLLGLDEAFSKLKLRGNRQHCDQSISKEKCISNFPPKFVPKQSNNRNSDNRTIFSTPPPELVVVTFDSNFPQSNNNSAEQQSISPVLSRNFTKEKYNGKRNLNESEECKLRVKNIKQHKVFPFESYCSSLWRRKRSKGLPGSAEVSYMKNNKSQQIEVSHSLLIVMLKVPPVCRLANLEAIVLCGTIDLGVLQTMGKDSIYLQEKIFEIVTSEASYLNSLLILTVHFMQSPKLSGKTDSESVITAQDHKELFSSVHAVRHSSERLFKKLKQSVETSVMLDNICDILADHLQKDENVFVNYCRDLAYQQKKLHYLKENNAKFVEEIALLEKSKFVKNQDLASFLLQPLQRVTRYPLLIRAIRSQLNANDKRIASVECALSIAQRVVSLCNESRRHFQGIEELFELHSKLIYNHQSPKQFPVITRKRRLIMKGSFCASEIKKSKTSSASRTTWFNAFLFLFSDALLITKQTRDNFLVKDYCDRKSIAVPSFSFDPGTNGQTLLRFSASFEHKFLVVLKSNHLNAEVRILLATNSQEDKEKWIRALNDPSYHCTVDISSSVLCENLPNLFSKIKQSTN
ncbi:Rho guanine nucleotide exchange factor 16 [Trichinella murrelli]|uniref:Rho guanine nucleotide exchange factor 16 n=1 Tax=Trichinella murrelli TaxID=144512 RepID=A0A0V0U1Z6_9BILA|nr:Rho guanine nucleotide exchange factor 16 [Trichinella murrelli]